jgi:hypothetical protein
MNPLPMPQLQQPPQIPEIKDIAPPVYVFPYPYWEIALAALAILLIIVAVAWAIRRHLKNRPLPPPPTPKEIALRSLDKARSQIELQQPYDFSILVSDILRVFLSAQFSLPATKQTSQEFLASLSRFPRFTEPEKALLAAFLDKSDRIKFARVDATTSDSAMLLQEAVRFVEGALP